MGQNSIKSLWKGVRGKNLSSERFSPINAYKVSVRIQQLREVMIIVLFWYLLMLILHGMIQGSYDIRRLYGMR